MLQIILIRERLENDIIDDTISQVMLINTPIPKTGLLQIRPKLPSISKWQLIKGIWKDSGITAHAY